MNAQPDIKLNPHPTQRYEITVTTDAPGPWDAVQGHVSYIVKNADCTPKNNFEGIHTVPSTGRSFTLTRVDDKTYRGYVYRDLLEGGNYFGLGVCHWEMENVGASFLAHGLTFSAGLAFYDRATGRFAVSEKPSTEYFSKREYFDKTLKDQPPENGMYISGGGDPEAPPFTANFGEPFPVTISVREIKS